MEPTYRQHKILERLNDGDDGFMYGEEEDIELFWELVRGGYLQSLVSLGNCPWHFKLTPKADDYLSTFEKSEA